MITIIFSVGDIMGRYRFKIACYTFLLILSLFLFMTISSVLGAQETTTVHLVERSTERASIRVKTSPPVEPSIRETSGSERTVSLSPLRIEPRVRRMDTGRDRNWMTGVQMRYRSSSSAWYTGLSLGLSQSTIVDSETTIDESATDVVLHRGHTPDSGEGGTESEQFISERMASGGVHAGRSVLEGEDLTMDAGMHVQYLHGIDSSSGGVGWGPETSIGVSLGKKAHLNVDASFLHTGFRDLDRIWFYGISLEWNLR